MRFVVSYLWRKCGDKPIGFIIIHIYLETAQGNSPCNYLYLKQAKASCISFYLVPFFFYKIGEQKGRKGPVGGGGQRVAVVGGGGSGEKGQGKGVGKWGRKVNMVQKNVYTCM
jgi:hypothetical protein